MEERLQKYMARCGVDSRRKCEELIAAGLVEINGEVVREAGVKIDPRRDRIAVEGKLLRVERPAYYLHYKVKGVTTTVSDDLGRKTVMDCLPGIRERVYPVGRLDKDSEGLLVLTNDGALANYLTHPAGGVVKTYRVVAEGRVEAEVLARLAEKGMRLGPALVKPARVELVRYDNDNTVVLISVGEGVNREVRRIFAALGHEVKKLLRTQVGPLSLAGMTRGTTRPMTPHEVARLRKGMEGLPDAEPPGGETAARKPSGSRNGNRRQAAPRRGKPDPAAAGSTGGRAAPAKPAPRSGGRSAPAGNERRPRSLSENGGSPRQTRKKTAAGSFSARGRAKNDSVSIPRDAAKRVPRQSPGAGKGVAAGKTAVRHPLAAGNAARGAGGRRMAKNRSARK